MRTSKLPIPNSAILEYITRVECSNDISLFTLYTYRDYVMNWHHQTICNVLNKFAEGEIKKLMIFAPPQTGKTELSTRRLSAYLIGRNPNLRIGLAAYNKGRAKKYAKDIKRIILDPRYKNIFPEITFTKQDKSQIVSNRSDYYEFAGFKGSFLSAGIGTALTGDPLDIGIIDDPIKDAKEANSLVYRENVYEWYDAVFSTRFHNNSQQLLTVTRWHEDDLAGRILAREGEEWTVIKLPAIKEDKPDEIDPRKEGEVLWPERHSLERMLKIQERAPSIFISMYQQRPINKGGNIIKVKDIQIVDEFDLPLAAFESQSHVISDTAYTKNTSNDPSALMSYFVWKGDLYVTDYKYGHWEISEYCRQAIQFVQLNGNQKTILYIEPKASGKSAIQRIKEITRGTMNVREFVMVDGDKLAKLSANQSYFESGRVKVLKGPWNEHFINEITGFPKMPNDEAVDCINMGITQGLERASIKPFNYGDEYGLI